MGCAGWLGHASLSSRFNLTVLPWTIGLVSTSLKCPQARQTWGITDSDWIGNQSPVNMFRRPKFSQSYSCLILGCLHALKPPMASRLMTPSPNGPRKLGHFKDISSSG